MGTGMGIPPAMLWGRCSLGESLSPRLELEISRRKFPEIPIPTFPLQAGPVPRFPSPVPSPEPQSLGIPRRAQTGTIPAPCGVSSDSRRYSRGKSGRERLENPGSAGIPGKSGKIPSVGPSLGKRGLNPALGIGSGKSERGLPGGREFCGIGEWRVRSGDGAAAASQLGFIPWKFPAHPRDVGLGPGNSSRPS